MNRRRMLRFAIGVGVGACASPLWAQNPAAGLRRVGVLAPSTRAQEEVTLKPFFDEMRKLGWIEGQTIAYDRAYADDRHQDLPRLAAELVARKPELIYAPPSVAALAAKQATRTIPIVFAAVTDPVGRGLVSSLARPGGNATGFVSVAESLVPKLIELLHEILPGAKRVGLLSDPAEPIPAARPHQARARGHRARSDAHRGRNVERSRAGCCRGQADRAACRCDCHELDDRQQYARDG